MNPMTSEALRELYGDEYPAAAVVNGLRLPLVSERRFCRSYHSREHKFGTKVSRFMDGSASITNGELQLQWHTWSESDRLDFCQECGWLSPQPDFPHMLRFVMEHGGPREWPALASSVARHLPCGEAFDILVRALHSVEPGRSANLAQAVALTRHPRAESTLRRHLDSISSHPSLMDLAEFVNWIAFDATTCISHLIELGGPPSDFESLARQLARHPCPGNRDSFRNFLSKDYKFPAQP